VPVEPSIRVNGANSTQALRLVTTTNARNVTAPAPGPGAVQVKPCCALNAELVCVSVAIEQPDIDEYPAGIVKVPTNEPEALLAHSSRPRKFVVESVWASVTVTG
jgi:hypothetical protein